MNIMARITFLFFLVISWYIVALIKVFFCFKVIKFDLTVDSEDELIMPGSHSRFVLGQIKNTCA